jgi:hypothetical protein
LLANWMAPLMPKLALQILYGLARLIGHDYLTFWRYFGVG